MPRRHNPPAEPEQPETTMTMLTPFRGINPFTDHLDGLLADVAINVQLPPGLHRIACERYERVRRHMEREGSPLKDRILHFYPQGSMAIDATISSRWTEGDYDLDVVAQLDIPANTPPSIALDLIERALEGYPARIVRQTRCVTVYFEDMHLDVTPAVRHPGTIERQSDIFHAKEGEPRSEHFRVPMNAYGFARWYEANTPVETLFAEAYNQRLYDVYGLSFKADAEVDEVPEQCHLSIKNVATVALQLMKRFRDIAYLRATGRIPPSVMLSCYAGHAAASNLTLSDMLIRQARMLASDIRRASSSGRLLHVANPVYPDDVFTDRWPADLRQQDDFAHRLEALVAGLEAIKAGRHDLEDVGNLLRDWFGKGVVSSAMERKNQAMGRAVRTGTQGYGKTGLFVPAAPAILTSVPAAAASRVAGTPHTFMGGVPW